MKFKNVKQGEKCILKGKKEDWYYWTQLTEPQSKIYHGIYANMQVGDVCVVEKVSENQQGNVDLYNTRMKVGFTIQCKFLKKIKGNK